MFITFVWIVDCRLHVFTVLISHADESVLIFLPFCSDDFELTNLIIQLDWLQEMVSLAKTCCDCTSFWSSSFLALGKSYPFFLLNYYDLENYPGVKINGENINNIRYADETVLIADSEENLQRLLDITIEKSEEMGLTLNVKKTECMVISKKAIAPSCNLQSRGQQIKLVKKFKYLGYMITSDGKCITEIKKRIATAKDAFQKLSLILKNRNI